MISFQSSKLFLFRLQLVQLRRRNLQHAVGIHRFECPPSRPQSSPAKSFSFEFDAKLYVKRMVSKWIAKSDVEIIKRDVEMEEA